MNVHYDIAIVGGSMAGLACAYHLRDSGARVVVLDRARVGGHRQSSSFGASRMYREMYSDSHLCGMSKLANRGWAELERAERVGLRSEHGLLFYGESWDEETIEGSIPGAREVMLNKGIPFESHDASSIAQRWPLRPKPEFTGLFEPTAGAIASDTALDVYAQACGRDGIELRYGTAVESLEAGVLHTRSGVIRADQVVLCAGAWTNNLLEPLGLALNIELWSMLWAHYAVDPKLADRYCQWFCFQRERPEVGDGGLYYGFPASSSDTPMIKVGIDWAPPHMRASSMDTLNWEPDPHCVELLDRFMRAALVGVLDRLEVANSPYTMTRDANFVLDRLTPWLTVFTGGSGQAFKFAPLIGRILADLGCGKPCPLDLTPWSATRDAVGFRA